MPHLRAAQRSVERKRAGGNRVSHRLYAAREDGECMPGLRAAELLSVGATATTGTATLCAWTCKTPLKASAQQRAGALAQYRAAHHPNPAEAHRRWRGKGSSRSRSVSVTTHPL